MASTHVYAGTARSMGAMAGGIFRQAVGDNRWEHLTNGVPEDAAKGSVHRPCGTGVDMRRSCHQLLPRLDCCKDHTPLLGLVTWR